LFRFANGSYAGCTVPHAPAPDERAPGEPVRKSGYVYRAGLARPIVPIDPPD
jgi:hypothetical protein